MGPGKERWNAASGKAAFQAAYQCPAWHGHTGPGRGAALEAAQTPLAEPGQRRFREPNRLSMNVRFDKSHEYLYKVIGVAAKYWGFMPVAAQWPKPVLLLQSCGEKNGLGLCFPVMPLSLTAEN